MKTQKILDEIAYDKLKSIWVSLPKTMGRPAKWSVEATQAFIKDPSQSVKELNSLAAPSLDGSDWLFPVRCFPKTIPGNSRANSYNLAARLSLISTAIDGGRIQVDSGKHMESEHLQSTFECLYKALYLYSVAGEPLESAVRRLRFSSTHRSFGVHLRSYEPSCPSAERDVRAFFRKFAKESKQNLLGE